MDEQWGHGFRTYLQFTNNNRFKKKKVIPLTVGIDHASNTCQNPFVRQNCHLHTLKCIK